MESWYAERCLPWQLLPDISYPLTAKGQPGLKQMERKWTLKTPLKSLTATLFPDLVNGLDYETPHRAKQHLHCTNCAFKDWSRPKETQKTYFFSVSYHEDLCSGWSSLHLSWREKAGWQGNFFVSTETKSWFSCAILSGLETPPLVDVLGKCQKTSIHNRIAGDSWGTISWNDGKGSSVDIWLDSFYVNEDLVAPGVLLKY